MIRFQAKNVIMRKEFIKNAFSTFFQRFILKRSALTLHIFNISERVLFHFKALRENRNCSVLLTFDIKCIIGTFNWAKGFGTEQL